MSHDQRPSKVRVVSGGGHSAQGTALGPASAAGASASGDVAGHGADAAPGLAARALPALLFLIGCAVGGGALTFWSPF